jgi:hypothetical protein
MNIKAGQIFQIKINKLSNYLLVTTSNFEKQKL